MPDADRRWAAGHREMRVRLRRAVPIGICRRSRVVRVRFGGLPKNLNNREQCSASFWSALSARMPFLSAVVVL